MITLLIANKSSLEHSSKDASNYRLAFQVGGTSYVLEAARMRQRDRKTWGHDTEEEICLSFDELATSLLHSLDYFDEKAFLILLIDGPLRTKGL